MKKQRLNIFVLLLIIVKLAGYGQHYADYMDVDYEQLFIEAESYFLYEDYKEAAFLYKKLINQYPDNANLKFRYGVSLLNIPYSKEESIPYLEYAAKNTISIDEHKPDRLEEKKAPEDACYYLARAYRINNELDQALKCYGNVKKKLGSEKFDLQIVNEEIEATEYAQELIKKPVNVSITNMGTKFNDGFAQINAVISGNGKVMIFISKLKFYDAVFFSRKVNDKWTEPVNIIPQLLVDGDCYPTSLSFDGTEAFFYRNDNYKGTIVVSNYYNNSWHQVEKLNRDINTRFWESHACVAADDLKLYFTSNRKGGYGGLDIYVSERDSIGAEWQEPINLGDVINTNFDEETPFFLSDVNRLFFSSRGHRTMGGFDIFYADKTGENNWTIPKNMGYPINSTDDDIFYFPFDGGKKGIISNFIKDDTHGKKDLYIYELK